jgi:hypothetical protein
MNTEDIQLLKELSKRIELGGNDGADIWDYEQVVKALAQKYNMTEQEVMSFESL